MKFYPLSIKHIQKLTASSVLIGFDIPNQLTGVFAFKPGQYITLKTAINGTEIRRDYSLCTTPGSGDFAVAIKAVSGGVFSEYANNKLSVGDTIDVAAPNGRFILEPELNAPRTIGAFAAGSGITPVLSIAKTLLENEPKSNFVLVYGNKTIGDTMFYDALIDLTSSYPNRFHIQFVFSRAQVQDALFGRIDSSTVNFVLKNKFKSSAFSQFYLCGPEEMITTVSSTLQENNIDKNSILYELFTPTAQSQAPEINSEDSSEVTATITVDEETFTISASKNQSLLESALKANIDAPYSCQGGICSSCIARLTEGEAEMRQNNILTDSELAEGLILTCQAHPKSATVKVDYDDI